MLQLTFHYSPVAFVGTEQYVIQRLLGKAGVDLWHELQGTPTMPLELHTKLPKSIARTASMGEVTSAKEIISSHLIHHTVRLATELVTKKLLTSHLTIFLKQKDFNSVTVKYGLEYPTNNYFNLSQYIKRSIVELYHPNRKYRACGIVASKLSREEEALPDLFGQMKQDAKQARLFVTMCSINKRFGRNTLGIASALQRNHKRKSLRFIYPVIQAS